MTLGLLFLCFAAQAASPDPVPELGSKLDGNLLVITPPAGHHLNTKAPASVRVGKTQVPFSLAERKLTSRLGTSASAREVSVDVFVCDDAGTYCRKKHQEIPVPALSAAASPGEPPAPSTLPAAPTARPARAHFEKETGFYVNDPDKAFALAARKKLPLLIDFFGIWCPPCNHLDAMIFRSADFRKKTSGRFVKLKLDADQDRFNALKSRYKIRGLPTVVFTTSSGDEILRLLGYHPLEEVLSKANAAYESRDEGYAQLATQASGGNAEARYKAARIALDQDEPAKALEWLAPLKDMFHASHDPRLAEYFRARLGVAQATPDRKARREVLEAWLKEFPASPDAIENYDSLAELQDEADSLKGSDYTPADVAEARADFLEKLGDPARTKEAYLACAEAYEKEAQAEGTAYPRGPNLERAYCLGRAGEVARSEAIYDEGIRRFPGEYTFYQGKAKMLLSAHEAAKALPQARKAVRFGYGNQRLKAMMTLVRAYEALGQPAKAIAAIDAELSAPPAADAAPGTLKLREQLRAKAEDLRKKMPARAST
jgi:thiol-disulfide isomerase/thioredoxin